MFWIRNKVGFVPVLFAVALIGGEVMGFSMPQLSSLWMWSACTTLFVAMVSVGWSCSFLRWAVAVLAGMSLAWHVEAERIAVDEMAHSFSGDGLPPGYRLRVESGVSCRCRHAKGDRIVCFASSIGSIPVRVVAQMDARGRLPSVGETWLCCGWLSLKKGSPSRYSRRTLWVMDRGHMERVEGARGFCAHLIYRRISNFLSRYAETGLSWNPELASLNKAMLFGRRSDIGARKRRTFAFAGTMHVFAISGLHVMLVAGVINMLLGKLRLSGAMRSACALPILAAYVMMSGARPSAVRAALMMSLWLGSGLFGRKPDSFAAWGVAAISVYGLSPAMVFDAGCALSFAVMLGIVLWIRWTSQFASPLDWLLRKAAEEAALENGRRRGLLLKWHRCGMWVLTALGISFAAWIAGAPVAARVFGRIAVGGIFANVAVVPLATISVVIGAAGAVASMALEPLGALLNNLAAASTWMMEVVSELTAMCPGASFETQAWSWSDCAMWYAAWVALFCVLSRHLPPKVFIPVKSWSDGDGDGHDVLEA